MASELQLVIGELQRICEGICSRIQSSDFTENMEHYYSFATAAHGISLPQLQARFPLLCRIRTQGSESVSDFRKSFGFTAELKQDTFVCSFARLLVCSVDFFFFFVAHPFSVDYC